MNQINLVGRITKDLELRKTSSSKSVCEFNLAVNRVGSENADFITCVVWNQQAENLAKYQSKGSLIGVSGSLRVEQYQDKEGNNRYKTYVLTSNIEYLSSKPKENESNTNDTDGFENIRATFKSDEITLTDDDLPF